MAEIEYVTGEGTPPDPNYGALGTPQKTGVTASLEDKINALLILNGIDPTEIEEEGIEAVKSRMGQLSNGS